MLIHHVSAPSVVEPASHALPPVPLAACRAATLVSAAVAQPPRFGFSARAVRASVLDKCGFQPRGDSTQVYSVEGSELCLTGTAEVPLGGLYMDQILEEKDLPVRMCAFGRCFRTEAGAAGMASKGLYRVHQFSKVHTRALQMGPWRQQGLDALVLSDLWVTWRSGHAV